MGVLGASQDGRGQVNTSRLGTIQVRSGQVKTSQGGQNGQVLLGTRVWPYSVLLVSKYNLLGYFQLCQNPLNCSCGCGYGCFALSLN